MIGKLKKYLGKINSIEDLSQDLQVKMGRIDEVTQNLQEKLVHIEKIVCAEVAEKKDTIHDVNIPISSIKTSEGIVYVGSSEDAAIFGAMQNSLFSYSCYSIDFFFDLTDKYYGKRKTSRNGFFLDIGANIGTTSIYVKKKINKNLKVIAFEPSELNYKLLRCNCIINNFDDIKCENFGLSNTETKKVFLYRKENSGGGGIIGRTVGEKLSDNEYIIFTKVLDVYLKDSSVSANDIDYIWLDVEGHEVEVLEGSVDTLQAKKIPLWSEFNACTYIKQNKLNRYADVVKRTYKSFIDCRNADIIHPIEEIVDFGIKMVEQEKQVSTDLFFC